MIVRLMGGLGNQMFQYAFGRAVSIKNGEPLNLDRMSFLRDKLRDYELGEYHIMEGKKQRAKKLVCNVIYYIHKKLFPTMDFLPKSAGMEYEDEVLTRQEITKKNRYWVGYWQHTGYFEDIRNMLIKEFCYKGSLTKEQEKIAAEIQSGNSVAMHIRRGDYISDKGKRDYVNLPREYYEQALQYIRERRPNIRIYIFSDDIQWCRQEYSDLADAVFIDGAISSDEHTDLELMKKCRHFVIANSTFSWWAAWLSENEDKIMIAPEHWFCDQEMNCRVKEAILRQMILM